MCPTSNGNLYVPDQYLSLKSLENTEDINTKLSPLFAATSEYMLKYLHQISIASCVSSRILLGHIYFWIPLLGVNCHDFVQK